MSTPRHSAPISLALTRLLSCDLPRLPAVALLLTVGLLPGCASSAEYRELTDAPKATLPDPLAGTSAPPDRAVLLARMFREMSARMPPAHDRPCNPWVVRGTLDGRPDTLVIALGERLCLAYDVTTCSLVKAWRGDVDWDGPLNTMAYGPQPMARGVDLHDPLVGSEWFVAPGVPARVHFAGTTLSDGRVTLHWEISDPRDERAPVARMHETPEVGLDTEGRLTLMRLFDGSMLEQQVVQLQARQAPKPDGQLESWRHVVLECAYVQNPDGTTPWDFEVAESDAGPTFTVSMAHGMGLLRKPYVFQAVR